MELRAPCKHMLWPYTHPEPAGRVIKGKKNLNVVMLHIKLKRVKINIEAKLLSLLGQVERSDIKIVQISLF